MKRKCFAVGIILLFVGISTIPSIAQYSPRSLPASRGNILYVGGSGPGNYSTIQAAIDMASDGDTVVVYNKTYNEHILVDKQLVMMGIPSASGDVPVIDGGDEKTVVITADRCLFQNFSVGSDWDYGIFLQANECIIQQCRVFKAWGNMKLYHASHNVIQKNLFSNSEMGGIVLENSSYNTITNNTVDFCRSCVVNLWRASCSNFICNNVFSHSNYSEGIVNGEQCSYNIYRGNMAHDAHVGFLIFGGVGISILDNSLQNGISFTSTMSELFSYTIKNNTINGKHIYVYWNEHDGVVPSDAGQVILVQCKDFTIQNLTISDVRTGSSYHERGGGICLVNCSGTAIQGTTVSSCSPVGISLEYSSGNTLVSNRLFDNYRGISCEHSHSNVISDNIIQGGGDEGIYLLYSSWNTIQKNTLSEYSTCILLGAAYFNKIDANTIMNKVVLLSSSDFNQITQNHIEGGVEINHFSLFNTVRGNMITNSDIGLRFDILSNSNAVVSNNITTNKIGVAILNCRLNKFQRNNFIRNDVHVYFEDYLLFSTLPDLWRRNYWDDWNGIPPKRIEGTMTILHISVDPEYPPDPTVLDWSYFDWFPAKRPYPIGVG